MIKIVLLILSIFASVAYLGYLIYTKKSSYMKYSFLILIVLVSVYNMLQTSQENSTHKIFLAFNNNKKIICNDTNITKINFNLVIATSVFVGKANSPYNSYVIPIETCKVGE